jgi:hypothetical protein
MIVLFFYLFPIIANAPRPLTETLAVWLEDYSKRYSAEWKQTQQQICIQGGPIFELGHKPLPWIEVYLSRWSGNRWGGSWGGNKWIKFQSLVCCHLAKKHLRRLRVRSVITVLHLINQQLPTTWYRVSNSDTKSLRKSVPIRC